MARGGPIHAGGHALGLAENAARLPEHHFEGLRRRCFRLVSFGIDLPGAALPARAQQFSGGRIIDENCCTPTVRRRTVNAGGIGNGCGFLHPSLVVDNVVFHRGSRSGQRIADGVGEVLIFGDKPGFAHGARQVSESVKPISGGRHLIGETSIQINRPGLRLGFRHPGLTQNNLVFLNDARGDDGLLVRAQLPGVGEVPPAVIGHGRAFAERRINPVVSHQLAFRVIGVMGMRDVRRHRAIPAFSPAP